MKNIALLVAMLLIACSPVSQASELTAAEIGRCESNGKYISHSLDAYWGKRVSRTDMNTFLTNALTIVLEETTEMSDVDIRARVDDQVVFLAVVLDHYKRQGFDDFKSDTDRLAEIAKLVVKVKMACYTQLLKSK